MNFKVVAWSATEQNDIIPLTRVDYRYPDDPRWGCESGADRLAAMPAGKRYLYVHGLGCTETGDQMFVRTDPAALVKSGGYYMPARLYMRRLYKAIKARNVVPDSVVLDYENGLELWRTAISPGQEWVDFVAAVFDDPLAKAALPADVRSLSPEAFRTWQTGFPAVKSWNYWACRVRARALRFVAYDTAYEAFGKSIAMTNHADYCVGSQQVPGPRGEITTGDTSIAGTIAPCVYLRHNKYLDGSTPDRWQVLIQMLNMLRACVNKVGAWRVYPWLSRPSYAGDYEQSVGVPLVGPWAWEQLLRHSVALGIKTFLWWNPRGGVVDKWSIDQDAAAVAIMRKASAEIKPVPKPEGGWTFIPYTSNEFSTGSIVSKLADFSE